MLVIAGDISQVEANGSNGGISAAAFSACPVGDWGRESTHEIGKDMGVETK